MHAVIQNLPCGYSDKVKVLQGFQYHSNLSKKIGRAVISRLFLMLSQYNKLTIKLVIVVTKSKVNTFLRAPN